jgi:Integrin beta cytoplasmic domain
MVVFVCIIDCEKHAGNDFDNDPTFIIIGVVTGILAVGLTVLLTWKVIVTLHDQREYARFEEERKLTSFGSVIFFL